MYWQRLAGLALAASLAVPGCTGGKGDRPDASVAGTAAQVPSDEYEIAFTSRREGNWTIFSVDQDGVIEEILDVVSVEEGPPRAWGDFLGQVSWAPDASRFAFTCVPRGVPEICVAEADGTVLRILTEDTNAQDNYPRWSADGERIYYTTYRNGSFDVFSRAPDGSDKQAVITGPEQTSLNDVSQDGSAILYDLVGENTLEIARLSGGEPESIHSIADALQGAWSPDGETVAFSRARNDLVVDLFLLSVETGEVRRLTRSPGMDSWPTWSPDGRKVAFFRDTEFRNGIYTVSDIYVVDVATRELTQLTDDPATDMQPAWRPVPGG